MPLGAEAEGAGRDHARLKKDVARRVLGIPNDNEVVAISLERIQAGGGGLLREHKQPPIGAAVFAGGFDLFARRGQRDARFFLGLDYDFRAGRRTIGAELDHAIADLAVLDQASRVARGSGDVACVLSLAGEEFEDGFLKYKSVPRRPIGFLPRRDDAGQRNFHFFLERPGFSSRWRPAVPAARA